ncbi:hypothetical protein [Mucilaginibacter sp. KACC 22063]|uniref:hypothetical protein n=1 Tax=Mucilaginibacter sp. KACC 22063 TaxID=3025666 RepID=UPI00236628CF|nr:hypothetical protein [Mucilaginibacter sp. KACC 22063]WDF57023.1 hypothetical protein PQ461_08145 [Mucilaginibacter sp. KACC 22063]
MKKLLFLLMFLPAFAIAQKENPGTNNRFKYCMLIETGKVFGKGVNVYVDYGDTTVRSGNPKDALGKKIKFDTILSALNYMGDQGWDLVNSFIIRNPNNVGYEGHYLMKRKL